MPADKLLGGAGPLRQRWFAWAIARYGEKAEKYLAPHKARVFHDLMGGEENGTILEIGAGAGANLRYFRDRPVKWIAVDPNPYMRPYLFEEARRLGMAVEVREGTAEDLPAPDASVDSVISTLVLCSVVDLPRALAETLRVLKPGGKFAFVEHVAAPRGTGLRRVQRAIRPLWQRMGDGCHPDRETATELERAGFAELHLERFDMPLPVVRPHIAGTGVKAR